MMDYSKIYQSKKDGKAFLEIDSNHLNKEFIYFSYFENGVDGCRCSKRKISWLKNYKNSQSFMKK